MVRIKAILAPDKRCYPGNIFLIHRNICCGLDAPHF